MHKQGPIVGRNMRRRPTENNVTSRISKHTKLDTMHRLSPQNIDITYNLKKQTNKYLVHNEAKSTNRVHMHQTGCTNMHTHAHYILSHRHTHITLE